MYQELITKKTKLSVIGLGYVGLPIALEFAKKVSVIGFDIKPERIELMTKGIDPSKELDSAQFVGTDIQFTYDEKDLSDASFHIIAVPTPIDEHNQPDLKPLISACKILGKHLKKGDYVIFESTVYPGCTEEDCVPILESESGLKYISDFKVGFSPERINPGDKVNTLTTIKKVTSGCDPESAEIIAQVYELIIKAGVHRASSIKVAEAAKIIENTQRDINIAFMNELSMLFNKLNINTFEVLEAAGTKWNFLKFTPGLVGGHCIGVDPYYLVYKARELGFHPQMMSAGRAINDSMGAYVASQTVKKLLNSGRNLHECRVLVMGITFKENVSDIRNSKVVDVIRELESYKLNVDIIDPVADKSEVFHEYKLSLSDGPVSVYDAIIIAVKHHEYLNLDFNFFHSYLHSNGVLVDLKGVYMNKNFPFQYWSL